MVRKKGSGRKRAEEDPSAQSQATEQTQEILPADVPRSDQIGTDEPEVMEVEDSRQPIGALLFKTETERTPITEENRERLDKILQ